MLLTLVWGLFCDCKVFVNLLFDFKRFPSPSGAVDDDVLASNNLELPLIIPLSYLFVDHNYKIIFSKHRLPPI